jgi:hypothetical protein
LSRPGGSSDTHHERHDAMVGAGDRRRFGDEPGDPILADDEQAPPYSGSRSDGTRRAGLALPIMLVRQGKPYEEKDPVQRDREPL